jgi:hypothetical protein
MRSLSVAMRLAGMMFLLVVLLLWWLLQCSFIIVASINFIKDDTRMHLNEERQNKKQQQPLRIAKVDAVLGSVWFASVGKEVGGIVNQQGLV